MKFSEVVRILASLEKERVDYAVFGGVALNLHGIVRATEVRIVTPRTLYWLKKDTVRDKDRVDAAYLKEKFDLEDAPGEGKKR